MNIDSLKTILLRDIADLKDIADILVPGYNLTKIEVQILKTRINNLESETRLLLDAVDTLYNNDNKIESHGIHKDATTSIDNANNNCNNEDKQTVIKHVENTQSSTIDAPHTAKTAPEKLPIESLENRTKTTKTNKQPVTPTIDLDNNNTPTNKVPPPSPIISEKAAEINKVKEIAANRKTLADQYSDATFSINELVAQSGQTVDRASALGRKPILDIHKAIKINDKLGFIRDFFNGDSQKYDSTIDVLNSLDSFEQALDFINSNFKWDQNSDSFKLLIDIVNRRYLQ